MGGFKGFKMERGEITFWLIYIPLWVDLKGCCSVLTGHPDRIYIPLWVDLKGLEFRRGTWKRQIYIPLWVDLKGLVLP